MNNYEFCAEWVSKQTPKKNIRVLDYGCGSGEIVKKLRQKNINAFGCDVFYEGGNYSSLVDNILIESGIIKKMDGNAIPFDNVFFDVVINNQVMEHVENIDLVLNEIYRVMKPGGVILSLFPDKGVWREGHCGIPFLHWFPKKSLFRVYYASAFRILGFGYHKGNKPPLNWSRDFCEWLDNWTYYRTQSEIDISYNKYFRSIQNIESFWLQERLNKGQFFLRILPESSKRFIVNKLAGMVFIANKPVK